MRKVLLVGDYPPPYGGLSVQIAALRGRLAALDDTEVRVLDIGTRRRERRPDCVPVAGPVDFAQKLLTHAGRGFAVHGHTNGHNVKSWIVALACAAAGLATGRRSLISLGSGLMPAFLGAASGRVRALARTTVRTAGALVVRNEACRAALLALGAPANAVRILPGFYGVTESEIGRLPYGAARFRRGHRPVVGAIASHGAEYGLALLLDAAARLKPRYPELGVLLVGPDRMEDGHPDWVLPIGELDRPALLASVRALDVFVRPTYFDGDASSVREALAMGVRVVASDTDFRPAGVRVFPRGDADALADAIEKSLIESPVTIDSTSLPDLLALYDALPLRSETPRRVRRPHPVTGSAAAPRVDESKKVA
jgi:glycosyltransferase involved in cell wall biosynthesis